MEVKNKISVSLLNCDFLQLGNAVENVNQSDAHWFHLDIMDGVFVPNISFGLPVTESIHKAARKPLDVHLMIVEPERYISAFKKAGAEILTVHYEACRHLHRTLQEIHAAGMMAGVSLNPHSPVELLRDILDELDLVLLMSVNPGFGGQKFIPQTIEKVKRLAQMRGNRKFLIQVDGGVDDNNIAEHRRAGVDVFVVGSCIFRAENTINKIHELSFIQ